MGEREPTGSLARLLGWRLAELPGRGFLYVEDDGPWSFARLAAASVTVGEQLGAVAAGDRVVVRVGNDERFLPAASAVWCRRAAVVAVPPAAPAEEVARIVAAMGATAVICDPGDPVVTEVTVGVPVVTFPRFAPADGPEITELAARYRPPGGDVGAEAALVLLTSGSTGEP
ncbi:MAG: hypothetical protein QOC67_6148, partial [Pseudonocardiales bacterium]|nr:hypothetical protein [Pseudonocardiales bacterium]